MFSRSSLEMLDIVAQLGSFTAAAEVLHKVPSAISYSVRQAEEELDVVLFKRLPRRVELTPAGEVFIDQARHLLRQMDQVQTQTRRIALGWQSTLRITLDNIVNVSTLNDLINDFYQEFEFAELQINMEVFNGSWEAISQNRADVVIGATSAIPVGGEFELKDMGALEWVFVMAPHHPCTEIEFLDEKSVSQYPAICLDDTSQVLPKRHTGYFKNQRRLLLPNWYCAIESLKSGVGVGYMPMHMAKPYLDNGELVAKQLEDIKPASQCCLVWKKDNSNKLIGWLIDYLGSKEHLQSRWLA
ncbi:DNA-binding transcriptional activator PunR [Vibrio maerlii]|uniref:DNA-binding transcriptional activator PunR n=1 Tax=Vibrio maerlii TaxID=2231648 RepID=UPI000E3D50D8|nr:DNA-binding transcriptional activator PunR [Vibrio maerlii]